jgi:hypothetical protein
MTMTSGMLVLDGLDHDCMLSRRSRHLHAARPAYPRMGDIAVTAYLIGGVDHYSPFMSVVRQHSGNLPEHRGLSDARSADEKDALAGDYEVLDYPDCPVHRATDTQGQPHDLLLAVTDRRDAMERALDACPVVSAEGTDALQHILYVLVGDLLRVDQEALVQESHLGLTPEIQHHLQQVGGVVSVPERPLDVRRQRFDQRF